MKPLTILLLSALFMTLKLPAESLYAFPVKTIDGSAGTLKTYQGRTILIMNVASKCGYTPQYAGLQRLYAKYQDRGFVILGFPANNFGEQEPGSNAEIKTFCSRTYNVTFPMFSKVSVKGSDKTPLYQFLTEQSSNMSTHGEIQWNFTKFLVSRDGKVLARFEPDVTPESPEVAKAIEAALK